jgi:hypothetical protein
VPAKSSRWCAPRDSLRAAAEAQMARLTATRLSRFSQSCHVRL